jgi:hypothetical protein
MPIFLSLGVKLPEQGEGEISGSNYKVRNQKISYQNKTGGLFQQLTAPQLALIVRRSSVNLRLRWLRFFLHS